jgi:hypothetical protein
MNTSGLFRALLVAALLAIAGGLAFHMLAPFAGAPLALRLVLLAVGAVTLVELARQADAGGGRMLLLAGWLLAAVALSLLDPRLSLWFGALALALWTGRCLLLHRRPLAALIDGALGLAAIAAALATLAQTRSVGLALWSFLLLQALSQLLLSRRAGPTAAADRFEAARGAAEAALRSLSRTSPTA